MALTINLGSLGSRIARVAITSGQNGTRRFSLNGVSPSGGGGLIGFVWNGFARFGGFLIGKVLNLLFTGIAFSFTLIWSIAVSTFNFVWNFNWNASDTELDAAIQQGFVQLAGTLGGTLGNALGYLVCGAVPGLIAVTFNEPLGVHMLEEVGEEAAEEIASNLANLIKQTGNQLVRMSLTWLYKNTRSLLRSKTGFIKDKLIGSGAIDQTTLDKAKVQRDQPWSFASAFEDAIESIPNPILENLAEEFFDEFSDACIEAGYIAASSMDTFFANHRLASINFFGGTETIEIYPNRTIYTP